MLKHLTIKHYAIIEELTIEFQSGLNIITGETGAGKSILIGALSLIFGERASTDVVRKGADKTVVEGIFGIAGNSKCAALLASNEIEASDELILRREISAKGQSRCFLNDSPVKLDVLKEAGDILVDVHGQHEHQSLLRTATHIELLDDFGGLKGLVDSFAESHRGLQDLIAEANSLRERERQLKERRDLYEFQIKDIDTVAPKSGEEDELEAELRILENAERLYEATSRLYGILYEGEHSVRDQLILARNDLEDLVEIDRSFEEARSECYSAEANVEELAKFIQHYNAQIEFNPARLEEIRDRLGQLSLLKKKYGGSLDSVISFREKIGKEFSLAENFSTEIAKMEQQIELVCREASGRAERLSSKRREVAEKLAGSVVPVLAELGIPHGRFEVRIENRPAEVPGKDGSRNRPLVRLGKKFYETTPKGIDFVEFFLSTNLGEDVKPLSKIASGGEISRVMLALKSSLAKSDRLPMLVFDEIDTGVSGRIAHAVGLGLHTLSKFHQIIAITHLPQIAGFADAHFLVEKREDGRRTSAAVRPLDVDERVGEVARLLSGIDVTEASLKSARELIEEGKR